MSPVLYTIVAQQFLSAIVIQFIQSALIDITHSVALWNIQASHVQAYNVVQDEVGTDTQFLNGRIQYHRVVPFSSINAVHDSGI